MPVIKEKKSYCPEPSDRFTEAEIRAAIIPENRLFPFHFKASHSKMEEGETSPADLDNTNNRALTSVQMTREMKTSNSCQVTLVFPLKSRPGIRRKIAEMFLAAMEKGMEQS